METNKVTRQPSAQFNYCEAVKNVIEKLNEMLEDIEKTTKNRHMSDFEYGRFSALEDALELLGEIIEI